MISCKHRGFGLLEIILVIGVIAVIVLLAIGHYQQMQRRELLVGTKSDSQIIKRALDIYFQRIGCYQDGKFSKITAPATQFQPNIVNDLGLSSSYTSRIPLVQSYSAFIIDSGQKTTDNKPIYTLRVLATLNLAAGLVPWYATQLDALTSGSNTIYWQSLPDNSYVQFNKKLWVLDASRQFFRQAETYPDANTSAQVSGSFCAY